jgi:hypothetical protein
MEGEAPGTYSTLSPGMISFAGLASSARELALLQVTPGSINNGLSPLIYGNIWCIIGFSPPVLSLAEMAAWHRLPELSITELLHSSGKIIGNCRVT